MYLLGMIILTKIKPSIRKINSIYYKIPLKSILLEIDNIKQYLGSTEKILIYFLVLFMK